MRKSWDEYFADIAASAASRSTCERLKVGAVIVRDRQIISTGYNGSVRGAPHCIDAGCIVKNDHCIATVHAEVNAILSAARNGHSTEYATIYVTHNPCLDCYKVIHQAGIKRIIYIDTYRQIDYGILGLNDNQSMEVTKLKVGNDRD